MQLTQNNIAILRTFVQAGDRIGYYTQLAAWGDQYAALALGVVTNETQAGATANIYFMQENLEDGVSIDWNQLTSLSIDLMVADLDARVTSVQNNAGGNLSVDTIWDYHKAVFASYDVSADAWTVDYVLNQLPTLAERQAFWDSLVTSSGTVPESLGFLGDLFENVTDYVSILSAAISSDVAGYADYVADVTGAGALALTAPSTDYGPFSVTLESGSGAIIGGDDVANTLGDTEGSDVLIGYDGNDVLIASYGNDRLYGGSGDDLLIGGSGRDRLIGDDGNDIIYAGTKVDDPSSDDPARTIDNSSDFIMAGSGNDEVYVGNGSDLIMLGDGNDTLYLESSSTSPRSVIWGGDGSDSYYFASGAHILLLDAIEISEAILLNLDIGALFQAFNDAYSAEYPYNYIIFNIENDDKIFIDGIDVSSISVETDISIEEYDDCGFNYEALDTPGSEYTKYYAYSISKSTFVTTERRFVVDGSEEVSVSLGEIQGPQGVGTYNSAIFEVEGQSYTIDGFQNGDGSINIAGNGIYWEQEHKSTTVEIDVTSVNETITDEHNKTVYYIPYQYVTTSDPVTTTVTDSIDIYLKPTGFDNRNHMTIDLNEYQVDGLNLDDSPPELRDPTGL
ncbi:hypothetical protein ACO34A_28665 (plasmid) [Rhizobium sp. ACO-34A]|nr:calcium-binding protein [Rhizobium sp. ACO-34A]ATN37739.1 hypothetical protein ACO34A_28665 [Rhizobium sp. ACO-34A]